MGNKITRRCSVIVDERYTRPQGLYPQRDVDQKKLRRLILDSKLAPCFPGEDEPSADFEECPICFLCYPSLNRSKCCSKGVCTECYLQMKSPRAVRAAQCPFCKSHNYAVEFRGVKSLEEKTMEAAEEQKVIEAKIRMRKQELLDDEEHEQRQKEKQRQEEANALIVTPVVEATSPVVAAELPKSCSSHDELIEIPQQETETSDSSCDDLESSQVQDASGSEGSSVSSDPAPQQQALVAPLPPTESQIQLRPAPYARHRDEEFDFDLEDIMVMEAIWQSIQEQGTCHSYTTLCEAAAASATPDASTPSSEANRVYQHRRSGIMAGGLASAIAALAERHAMKGEQLALKSLQSRASSEVGTSSACGASSVIPPQSFEDQMMLAMALSITDAQSRARLEDNHPRPLPNPLPNVS